MKTLGLIGGTSWHSTIAYYRLINQLVGEKIGTQANPPLILHSINIELMREQDVDKINAKYGTKFNIPVTYYSTLMSVAYGKTGKESGLDGQIIKAKQLEAIASK